MTTSSKKGGEKFGKLTIVGVRESARHRKCTHRAVSKAIETGRLSQEAYFLNDRGWPRIYLEIADVEWSINTDQTKQRKTQKPTEADGLQQETLFEQHPNGDNGNGKEKEFSLVAAQTLRMQYVAQREGLKLRQDLEQLIDKDEHRRELFQLARELRDAILQVPDRIAAECTASRDIGTTKRILLAELKASLRALTRVETDAE
jgi:hypothetical protein